VEVPAILTQRERRHLRRAGKSDPGDALAIARVALREQSLGPVKVAGVAEDLKLLTDARDQRVLDRTRAATASMRTWSSWNPAPRPKFVI